MLHCSALWNCIAVLLCCSWTKLRSCCSQWGSHGSGRVCHPRLPYTPPSNLPTTAVKPSNHINCTQSFLKSYGLVSVPLTLLWARTRCTLHSALCTLHPAPCTLHSALCTLHSALCTLPSALCTLHSALCTLLSAMPSLVVA